MSLPNLFNVPSIIERLVGFAARRGALTTLLAMTACAPLSSGWGQIVSDSTIFRNEVDDLLTIRRISVLPTFDNIDGIYARPLEDHIRLYFERQHRFELSKSKAVGDILTPLEIQGDPEAAKKFAQGLDADAFVTSRVVKGPSGISIELNLFLAKDGRLLAESQLKDSQKFKVDDLRKEIDDLLNQIVRKIPYDGLVLSRQGERVTVNIGKRDGVQPEQIVTVVKIIKAQRHPKFNFLISSEKEILGRIRLLKVEETLSFGKILSEVERNAVQRSAKVIGLEQVKYADDRSLSIGEDRGDLSSRPDAQISFGQNPAQWVPKKSPSFGMVAAKIGLGSYSTNMKLTDETLSGSAAVYPNVSLQGELWLNSRWSVATNLRQGIIEYSNPASSGPSRISVGTSYYDLMFSRVFRGGSVATGPRAEVMLGLASYQSRVDDTDNGFTSTNYSGWKMAVGGQIPVGKQDDWILGAYLNFFLTAKLNEAPRTSGNSSDSSINQFSLNLAKRLGVNLQAIGSLDVDLYSSTFSGTGQNPNGTPVTASSLSQRHTTVAGGVAYLF
jgi:hypothetical protein